MTSNIYDNDCSIIKQPVTVDEFRKEIDLLKEEITKLKKAKNNFIIDLVDFDKEDKEIEEKYKELLLYLKSLIETPEFEDNGIIKIKYKSNETMYEKIRDLIKGIEGKRHHPYKTYIYSDLLNYLKKRNLSLIFPAEPMGMQFVDDNIDFAIIKYHRVNINHINMIVYNGRSYFIL